MITINDKIKCCGCAACSSICPKNCIKMKNDNEGFKYPSVDNSKCVNCGLCEKVCPILNKLNVHLDNQQAALIQLVDENKLNQSTAGGAFTMIAEYVIDNHGIVFGVEIDKNYTVKHTYVEDKDSLYKFRNSKYVQSDISNSYLETQEFLQNNKLVCFSGTPCQIQGLKKFL